MQETPEQTRGTGDRQVVLRAGRDPRDKAGGLRDRQGPQLRAALTSALGDLQQASAGDGDATLLLRGDSGGLLGRPVGGGPCRVLRDQWLLAKLCHISIFCVSEGSSSRGPPALTGCPAEGPGTAGPLGGPGGRAELPETLVSEAGSPHPPPRAPLPAQPLCVGETKRSLCRGPDKGGLCGDCRREEPVGQGSRGTWSWPWHRSWHTVVVQPVVVAHGGAQPCLGAERALRVGGGPVCPGQHRGIWHPVGAGALAPRATTEPRHHCVTG